MASADVTGSQGVRVGEVWRWVGEQDSTSSETYEGCVFGRGGKRSSDTQGRGLLICSVCAAVSYDCCSAQLQKMLFRLACDAPLRPKICCWFAVKGDTREWY